MSVINTNISALAAQSSLRKTALTQDTSMERLSTGIRINSAKDDAAGLAISTRMTANIRGISAAIRNANDGISLTQTAEGSLSAIQDNLQRIRELAVQSSNTGNNASDRSALNNEASQLIQEIDRVANNSAFNGIKLLDGSFTGQTLQVGAGNEANDRIEISISSAKSDKLGAGSSASITGAAITSSTALTAGGVTVNGYQVGASSSDGVSYSGSTGSAIAKANAINAISGKTGVTATLNATTTTFTATAAATTTAAVTYSLTINGVAIASGSNSTSPKQSASNIAAAINAVSAQTGVTASISDADSGAYTLTAADGRNITVEVPSTGTASLTGVGSGGTTYGSFSLSTSSSAGITLSGSQATAAIIGAAAQVQTSTATAGSGVGSVNLNTASGAQSALTTLDRAINTITDARASMGAYQNRLSASISNLETTSMNLSASRSRILDTDYAKETTLLAKSQIITQAATAMLAQANQSSQSVLALLK